MRRHGGKQLSSWTAFVSRTGVGGPAAGGMSWWMIYPLTLLECMLMSVKAAGAWCVWRVVYFRWWYPGSDRRRPASLSNPEIDVQDSVAAMQTIERIARESHARIFWISGTLLGLERLGHPLPHDKDLDVGIHVDDAHCLDFIRALWESGGIVSLVPQFLSRKVRAQNPDLRHVPCGIIRYMAAVAIEGAPDKPPVKLDVFLHFPYGGGVVHGTRNSLWWNTTPGVARKAYGENTFSVPEDAHLYLEENYGNYQQEVREFENSIDCPNAMDVFSWKSLNYLLARQRLMLRLDRVARARQVNRRLRSTLLKGLLPLAARRSRVQRGS